MPTARIIQHTAHLLLATLDSEDGAIDRTGVSQPVLVSLQAAVAETTSTGRLSETPGAGLPEDHAEIVGDRVNPRLRL